MHRFIKKETQFSVLPETVLLTLPAVSPFGQPEAVNFRNAKVCGGF
jgi:hypothetical protein